LGRRLRPTPLDSLSGELSGRTRAIALKFALSRPLSGMAASPQRYSRVQLRISTQTEMPR
ncbi:MAG TPA: hypothetical protein VIM21_01755, partial [Gemmatimonadaceae bacterium]